MNTAQNWKECFTNWPKKMPRRGVVVTSLDEQIPFKEFMTSESLLLLERNMPDTVGTRNVMVPYETIALVKIIDVVETKQFHSMGFEGKSETHK